MDYLGLAIGLALPWVLGWSVLLVFDWPRSEASDGLATLRIGYAYFIGAIVLTLWMRVISATGMHFGWATIGLPLLAVVVLLLVLAWRRGGLAWRLANPALLLPPERWQRLLWIGLVAWIVLRMTSLAVEIAWRPLYPWNAWTEWATKARVWYELGHMVPFVDAGAWLAGASGAYFDGSPGNPATIPLLQVWSCIALGRWDDSAMNWPWLLTLAALAFAIYGALRDAGSAPLAALLGTWLVVSLPLLDVQVALAGYPDLLLASVYALTALAFYRWSLRRNIKDACAAAILALFCPLIEPSGWFWTLALLPGIVVALLPARGMKIVGIMLGVAILLLLALERWGTALFGRGIEFAPAWRSIVASLFLFDNWHLLWYGAIALVLIGGKRLIKPPLASLAMIVGAAMVLLFVVFSYPTVAAWIGGSTATSRAVLPLAPLLVCLGVVLWNELTNSAPMTLSTTAPSEVVPKSSDA